MSLYNGAVAEYFDRASAKAGSDLLGEAGSEQQGAWIQLSAGVIENKLLDVGFRSFACPHIIAACNWLAERLEGESVDALLELPLDELRTMFDIPVEKAGKLLILQDAARAGLTDYKARSASS